MRSRSSIFLIAGLLFWSLGSETTSARQTVTATHTVSIGIEPITVMSISGDPTPFLVERMAGDSGGLISEASTFYNVTTNVDNVYLSAELDFPMPEGTALWISGESVLGNSHGSSRLTGGGEEIRLASGIRQGLENGRTIEYQFEYDEAAADIPFQSRNITFSLVNSESKRAHQIVRTVYFGINSPTDSGSSTER